MSAALLLRPRQRGVKTRFLREDSHDRRVVGIRHDVDLERFFARLVQAVLESSQPKPSIRLDIDKDNERRARAKKAPAETVDIVVRLMPQRKDVLVVGRRQEQMH